MRVLALDTTTRAGSVALAEDGRVIFERLGDAARSQAERLPVELLDALRAVGWSTADIDLYAVAAGPGSFTGLRIGIATIQGLALVHGKPVAPISALEALAEAAAIDASPGARLGVWMDAHRREVFSALYDLSTPPPGEHSIENGEGLIGSGSSLTEIEGPMASSPAATLTRWSSLGLPTRVCGDGAVMYASLLPPSIEVVPTPALASFVARLACRLDAGGGTRPPSAVRPLYVRRPDVELVRDAARGEP